MTTKRKSILSAIAKCGVANMGDLLNMTGLERKNLHDNLKTTIDGELIERILEDNKPAYKLTAKGKQWLHDDAAKPQSPKPDELPVADVKAAQKELDQEVPSPWLAKPSPNSVSGWQVRQRCAAQ